jgi:hypothetical protein
MAPREEESVADRIVLVQYDDEGKQIGTSFHNIGCGERLGQRCDERFQTDQGPLSSGGIRRCD